MWQLIWGPTLHATMGPQPAVDGDNFAAIKKLKYMPSFLESRTQRVLTISAYAMRLGLKLAPFVLFYCFVWRGWTAIDDATWVARRVLFLYAGLSAVYVVGLLLRAVGRARNPAYKTFLRDLTAAGASPAALIHQYDFDFTHVPIRHHSKKALRVARPAAGGSAASLVHRAQGLVADAVCWSIAHGFARHIIYPGALVGAFMDEGLLLGRMQLVAYRGFQRAKIATPTGLEIDTVYLDRRGRTANGNTLVVVCQGNCSFYEVAMLDQPFVNGYSVFGWNHPGYGHSTGSCSDATEIEAVNALLDFILNELHWPEQDIIVYGWSIGGFSAAVAASLCPRIRGLVLDATFADLLPMATTAMPPVLEPVVRRVISRHFDLDVLRHTTEYTGPLLLIKRQHDDIMASGGRHRSCTDLLVEGVLLHRFPSIFTGAGMGALRNFLDGTRLTDVRPTGSILSVGSEEQRVRWATYLAASCVKVLPTGHNDPLPALPDIFAQLPSVSGPATLAS